MIQNMKRRSIKAGLPPGTLVHLGEKKVERVSIQIIDYDQNILNERFVERPEDCQQYIKNSTVTWINITGLHDTELLQTFGDLFNIHPLVLEDIVNTSQRPKMEDHEEYLFLVLKMLRQHDGETIAEQVSLILGKHYVFSFQEMEGDVFDMIRDRIRTAKGRIRKEGCDYLVYSLTDAIVDNYFVILEDMGDRIETIQETVLRKSDPELLEKIHQLRRENIFMRKNLWPLRELLSAMEKSESNLIKKTTKIYLRDVYEHNIQVVDTLESLRDMLSGALEIYLSSASNKMNEIMKVLTIISTIFIPLTFVAGIYGMNFEHMPELKLRWAYPAVWIAMILTVIFMISQFKRKKWF